MVLFMGWSDQRIMEGDGQQSREEERNIDSDLSENRTKLAQFCQNGNVQILRKGNQNCPW